MRKFLFIFTLFLSTVLSGQVRYFPGISFNPVSVPGTPMEQIQGDLFLLWEPTINPPGTLFGQPVNGHPMTTASGALTDEGAAALNPVTHEIMQMWGDTGSVTSNGTVPVWYPGITGNLNLQCTNQGGYTGGSAQCLLLKDISFYPANVSNTAPFDPYLCAAIYNYDAALNAGNLTATIDYTNCPIYSLMVNTTHTATASPKFAVITANGMTTDSAGNTETVAGGREATGCAFPTLSGIPTYTCNWIVTRTAVQPLRLHFSGESIVFVGPAANAIQHTGTTELILNKSAVISTAPQVKAMTVTATQGQTLITRTSGAQTFAPWMAGQLIDINGSGYVLANFIDSNDFNLTVPFVQVSGSFTGTVVYPNQDTSTGKFMETAVVLMDTSTISSWLGQLPLPLQSASQIVLYFGASFAYRQSTVYLAVADPTTLAASVYTGGGQPSGSQGGNNALYYLTGVTLGNVPIWTQGREDLAIPLFDYWNHNKVASSGTIRCVGEHSVVWSPGLMEFVMGYGSAECNGLKIRTSPLPWGLWTNEFTLLPNTPNGTGWANKLIIQPGANINHPDMQTGTPAAGYPACAGCNFGVASNQWYSYTNTATLVTQANGASPYGAKGNAYGLNIYPVEHILPNGQVQMFGSFAAFNPYQVFLMGWIMTPSAVSAPATQEPIPDLPTGITTTDFKTFPGTTMNTTYPCNGYIGTGTVWPVTAGSSASLQAALTSAQPGDIVSIPVATYAGQPLRLPAKTFTGQYVCVISANLASLHAQGWRVAPGDAVNMPHITGSTTVIAPFTGDPGTGWWWFAGLEVYSQSTFGGSPTQNPFSFFLFDFSNGCTHCVFDRVYLHGAMGQDIQHGISWAGGSDYGAILDSYLDEFHQSTNDAQAWIVYASEGPWKFNNNYFAATTEDGITGGAGGFANTHHPHDFEIRNNLMSKNLAWLPHSNNNGFNTCSVTPCWSLKNDFEFKDANRALLFGNHFQYTWNSAGGGSNVMPGIRFTNRGGQSGPDTVVANVTMVSNFIDNTMQGFTLLGWDNNCTPPNCINMPGMYNMYMHNNLIVLAPNGPDIVHKYCAEINEGSSYVNYENNTCWAYTNPPERGPTWDNIDTGGCVVADVNHPRINYWERYNVTVSDFPLNCATPTGTNLLNLVMNQPTSIPVGTRFIGNYLYTNPATQGSVKPWPANNCASGTLPTFVNIGINNYELATAPGCSAPYQPTGVKAGYDFIQWSAALATTDTGH